MLSFRIILIVISLVANVLTSEQLLPQGLFHLSVLGVEDCPNNGENKIQFDSHLRRISMKRVDLDGKFTSLVEKSEKVKIDVTLDRWGNGGWRPNFYTFKHDDSCNTLVKFIGEPFKNIVGKCISGECLKDKPGQPFCPINKGVYESKGFDTKQFDNVNIPAGSVGKWRVSMSFLNRTNAVLGCVRYIFKIEPKKII